MLTGGASTRFGSDKAAAVFGTRTLLDRSLDSLSGAGIRHLVYVGGPKRPNVPAGVRHVQDTAKGSACPLRGIVTALEVAASKGIDRAVIVSCDLPLLTARSVAQVLGALDDASVRAVVAHGEVDHWSCVAVRTDALPELEHALREGVLALHRAFHVLAPVRVQLPEHELINANEPAVLAASAHLSDHKSAPNGITNVRTTRD